MAFSAARTLPEAEADALPVEGTAAGEALPKSAAAATYTYRRVLAASLIVLFCTMAGLAIWRTRDRQGARLVLEAPQRNLPADGAWHRVVAVRRVDGRRLKPSELTVRGAKARLSEQAGEPVLVEVRSPVLPSTQALVLGYKRREFRMALRFAGDDRDGVGDGTPDFLRLHTAADRTAFRVWFATLADAAAALPPGRLPREIDDCAALLRWSYRGALHAHDDAWLGTMPFDALPPLASVEQFVYPLTPLGANLFRVREGGYTETSAKDGSFAQFADARTLWQRNTFFLGRNVRSARQGDLLFFRQLEQNSPYHSMVLTGAGHDWAVYHTGPIGEEPGEVRRVAVADLEHHPDVRWRPLPDNSNFLGVYRWNILREDGR